RLEQVMVRAIDEKDVRRRLFQSLGGRETAKASAHDDDAGSSIIHGLDPAGGWAGPAHPECRWPCRASGDLPASAHDPPPGRGLSLRYDGGSPHQLHPTSVSARTRQTLPRPCGDARDSCRMLAENGLAGGRESITGVLCVRRESRTEPDTEEGPP